LIGSSVSHKLRVSRCGLPVVLPCSAQNEEYYTSVQNEFQLAGIVESISLAFNKRTARWRLCGLLEAVRLESWLDACRFPGPQGWVLDLSRARKAPSLKQPSKAFPSLSLPKSLPTSPFNVWPASSDSKSRQPAKEARGITSQWPMLSSTLMYTCRTCLHLF
jgi:hypothetical protein